MDNIKEIIKDKIEELTEQISGDGNILEKFKSDPIDTVKELLGKIDLSDDTIQAIVAGIKAKLGADKLDDLADKAKDLFGKLTGKDD